MQAKHSFRSIELRGSCLSCASGLLAAKVSRGAGLRASDGVRMVWWGFGALKTPRRASSLPTLQRRLPELPSGYKRETEGLHFDYKKAALGLHRGCTNAALVLHRGCRPRCGRSMPGDCAAQDE